MKVNELRYCCHILSIFESGKKLAIINRIINFVQTRSIYNSIDYLDLFKIYQISKDERIACIS